MTETKRRTLSTSTLTGDDVVNESGDDLGTIEDFVLDLQDGRVEYAVLSFGGFLGMGDKLFAVPFKAMRIDQEEKRAVLDVSKETLENAPGFDKNNWPDFADRSYTEEIHSHWGTTPRAR